MTITKDKVLQIRLDSELLRRYKHYADTQGLHISIAIRQQMMRVCDHFEHQEARSKVQQERELTTK
jgi:antitoxin component of RelBE/YafQ-DinJ toxin-antitoxin module